LVCNFGVIASGFFLLLRYQMFDSRSAVHAVERPINHLILRVRVSHHHLQGLVA